MPQPQSTLTRQLSRFATVGVLNTLVGVAVIFACYQLLGFGLILSTHVHRYVELPKGQGLF